MFQFFLSQVSINIAKTTWIFLLKYILESNNRGENLKYLSFRRNVSLILNAAIYHISMENLYIDGEGKSRIKIEICVCIALV